MENMERVARAFEVLARLVAETLATAKDLHESADETVAQVLFDQAKILGWDWERDEDFTHFCLNATPDEIWERAAVVLRKKHLPFSGFGFIHVSRAWYGKTTLETKTRAGSLPVVDEVWFSQRTEDGGCGPLGEAGVRWVRLSNVDAAVPWIEFADDALKLAARMAPVISTLAADHHDKTITPEAFCRLLLAFGFKDMTEEKPPEDLQSRADVRQVICPVCAHPAVLTPAEEEEGSWQGRCRGRPSHGIDYRDVGERSNNFELQIYG